MQKFAEGLFSYFILHPSRAPPKGFFLWPSKEYTAFRKKRSALLAHWKTHVDLMGTFRITTGGVDAVQRVKLASIGWAELISNTTEIHITYHPPQGYAWVDGRLKEASDW